MLSEINHKQKENTLLFQLYDITKIKIVQSIETKSMMEITSGWEREYVYYIFCYYNKIMK